MKGLLGFKTCSSLLSMLINIKDVKSMKSLSRLLLVAVAAWALSSAILPSLVAQDDTKDGLACTGQACPGLCSNGCNCVLNKCR